MAFFYILVNWIVKTCGDLLRMIFSKKKTQEEIDTVVSKTILSSLLSRLSFFEFDPL